MTVRQGAEQGVASTCPRCGAPYWVTDAFCGSCGQHLASRSGEPAEPAPSASSGRPSPPAAPRVPPGMSDATRYLCAAVHRDRGLAEQILDQVVDQPYKASPRSPDVDLATVVLHTLAARRRGLVADLVVTIFVIGVLGVTLGRPSIPTLVLAVIVGVGGVWVITFGEQLLAVYGPLGQGLRPRGAVLAPPLPGSIDLRQRLAYLVAADRGNVSVYSGYSPFFGSGAVRESWSFALDILRAAEGATVRAFTADELHDFISREVRAAGWPRVAVEDRMFVDGRDVAGDGRFVRSEPAPPAVQADPRLVHGLRAAPEDRLRPYACFHVLGWSGQLVSSTYLRFVVTRRHLYAEATHCLLAPIKEKFQEIDRIAARPTLRQASALGARTLLSAPWRPIAAPLRLLQVLQRPFVLNSRRAEQRREIKHERTFDYGADYSPRQAVADPRFQRYFQELDEDQYVKIIQKIIFRSMVDFLDDHGVDTHELAERQTTIQNNGVLVTGSATVNATNIAAGPKAKATNTNGQAASSAAARLTARAGRGTP